MSKVIVICFISVLVGMSHAQSHSTNTRAPKTLADALSRTAEMIGPAPDKYRTPFIVVAVTPIDGTNCSIDVVTNGTEYSIFGSQDDGTCKHIPRLRSFVWGRVRHSGVATFLRQYNVANMHSDYVDLVYESAPKVKATIYIISTAEAIPADWGQ